MKLTFLSLCFLFISLTICLPVDEMDMLEKKYMPEIANFEKNIGPAGKGKSLQIIKEEEEKENISGDKISRIFQVGEEVKDLKTGDTIGRLKEDLIQNPNNEEPIKHVVIDVPSQDIHIHEHMKG